MAPIGWQLIQDFPELTVIESALISFPKDSEGNARRMRYCAEQEALE